MNDMEAKKTVEDEETRKRKKTESRMILKNVLMLTISFIFLFSAYFGIVNMQSSINPEMGAYALIVLYVAMLTSSLFLPSFLMKHIRCKWTMCLSMITYAVYVAGQSYPTTWVLMTSAFIIGVGASPLWTAHASYFTQIGCRYAKLNGRSESDVIGKFFSFFFGIFQISNIIGGILGVTSLSVNREQVELDEEALSKCGVNYCPADVPPSGNITGAGDVQSNLDVSDLQRWILAGVFTGLSLLAALIIAVGVDPLERFVDTESRKNSSLTGMQLLSATIRQCLKPRQLLLIPITFWNGYQESFYGADFTAYAGCAIGVASIGYILVVFGAVDAVCANVFGFAIEKVGRPAIMILAALVHIGALVGMLLWQPEPNQSWFYFFLAVMLAIADSVWIAQVNAFYGAIFEEDSEAAFSAYQLLQSFGFIAGYLTHKILCLKYKIYTFFVLLLLSMVGYGVVEFMERKKRIHPMRRKENSISY